MPRNVCLCTETYTPLVGGGETQARALAEGLVARGYQVTILTRRTDRTLAKREVIGGAVVWRLPPVGAKHIKKWGLLFTVLPRLWRERGRYDLIFVSGFRILGLPVVLISKLLGKQCVLKADSVGEMSGQFFAAGLRQSGLSTTSWLFRLFLWVRNPILRQADAFVAISDVLAEEFRRHGVAPQRIHAIPNSVETRRFFPVDAAAKQARRQQLGLPLIGKIVIYTGRLVSYKGLPLLLRVWQALSLVLTDAHLLLVGEGGLDMHNCEADLRQFVTTQQMQDRVTFTGAVQNVPVYLQAADLFVFPTEDEAFGLSLVEAMACGLPVVASAVGGVCDIVQDGVNGRLIPAGHFADLYETLLHLLRDEGEAAQLGAAACQTVQERYTSEQVTHQFTHLFTQLRPGP